MCLRLMIAVVIGGLLGWLGTNSARAAEATAVTKALSSNDSTQIDQAIADIRAMLVGPPRFGAIENLKARWLRTLITLKRHDDAAELALAGVLAWPLRLADVEPLMKLRVEALLAAGKHQEALAAAKGLFNVCSMASTSEAINILHTGVRLAHADNPSVLAQFRQEQETGAVVSDRPTPRAGLGTVKASIVIDPRPFDEALTQYGDDYDALICRGNLLLLSDRPREARRIFEIVYEQASDAQLAEATENLVRCVKAEDGSIGRANKMVLDLRPGKQQGG